VVGSNTSGNGNLEVLRLRETLRSEVTRVEWSGDDDLGVNELLVELAVLALLVGGGHQCVALVFEPLPDAELVLGRAQHLGLHLGVLLAIVKDEENFALS